MAFSLQLLLFLRYVLLRTAQLRKAFLGETVFFFFFRFTAALTGTKSLLTRSGSESESCKGPGYH